MQFRLSRLVAGAAPLAGAVLLFAVACGPSATATPTPTATTRPTNTPVPQQATATPVPQQATATPTSRPAATPTVVATPTTVTAATPTPSAQAKKGGVLVTWIRREPANYDSVQVSTIDFAASHSSIYSKLLDLDKETTSVAVPDLAEKWDISQDGRTVTFHLRKNVKYHDGVAFSSQDVLDYFDRVMNPPEGVISVRKANTELITGITAPDANTVVFKLEKADPEFLLFIADSGNMIQPKRLYEKYGNNPTADQTIGTGPFKMKSWERNNHIEVVRNPDYFKPGQPYLDGIKWAFGRDQATMFAAFRTGAIDISSRGGGMDLTPEQMKIVEELPGAHVENYMVGSPYNFTGNVSRGAPWNDKRVRQAVDLGLDRQFICEAGLGGLCTWGFILAPWSPLTYSGEEVLKWPGFRQPKDQDLAKAKALLKDAGYTSPIPVTVMVRDSITRIAEPFAFSMEQIGFKVTLQIVDTVQYQANVESNSFAAAIGPVGTWGPSLNEFIPEYLGQPNTQSQSKHTDPKLDEMWRAQSVMLDPQQRRTAVRGMLDYMKDEAYHTVLFGLTRPIGAWNYVKNFKAPFGPQHYNLKYDDVWLER